jgi:segregation and condensation protein A
MADVSEKGIMGMILSDYPWEQVIYRIICEEAMDPWDLDISKLSEVFIGHLAGMKKLDFRIPAKYIIIAAVLLKMKTDHLDFIEMVKETMEGPEPYPEDAIAGAEGLEAESPGAGEGPGAGAGFDAVRLHERRVHHRKVMFEDLVFALRRALKTEHRKERRVARRGADIRIERVDISKRIKELYRRIDYVLAKLKDDEVTFSSVVEEWNRENILKNFMPLMHLDTEKKVDCRQEKFFDEIFIRKMEGE